MSLLSNYLAAVGDREVPVEVSLKFADSLKGLTLEEQKTHLQNFIIDVLSDYPIEDMDRFMSAFYPEYLPEDDAFLKAFRERNIPLYTRLAYADYAATHPGEDGGYMRRRLAEEMEHCFPLKKWAAKLRKQQEGKSEAERQRLELKAVLKQQARMEAYDSLGVAAGEEHG